MSAIAEKYARATRSSHLEYVPLDLGLGDLDTIIAAGLADGLGTSLLRIRFEFDSIRGLPNAHAMRPALKSARSVRERLAGFVVDQGMRRGRLLTDDQTLELVAQLLDIWIEPNCQTCTGIGQVGKHGTVRPICPTCDGSQRRQALFEPELDDFARYIADRMQGMVDIALERIRRYRR